MGKGRRAAEYPAAAAPAIERIKANYWDHLRYLSFGPGWKFNRPKDDPELANLPGRRTADSSASKHPLRVRWIAGSSANPGGPSGHSQASAHNRRRDRIGKASKFACATINLRSGVAVVGMPSSYGLSLRLLPTTMRRLPSNSCP